MKKNKKLVMMCALIGAIVLLGVGTIAYFRREVSGNVSGTAGSLVLKVNEIDSSTSGTLAFNIQRSETENFVMPGDSGSFVINVDSTGSSTGVDITLAITDANLPTNMKFYADAEHTEELTTKTYTIAKSASMTQSITVYWFWDGEQDDDEDNEFLNASLSAKITVTATSTAS